MPDFPANGRGEPGCALICHPAGGCSGKSGPRGNTPVGIGESVSTRANLAEPVGRPFRVPRPANRWSRRNKARTMRRANGAINSAVSRDEAGFALYITILHRRGRHESLLMSPTLSSAEIGSSLESEVIGEEMPVGSSSKFPATGPSLVRHAVGCDGGYASPRVAHRDRYTSRGRLVPQPARGREEAWGLVSSL